MRIGPPRTPRERAEILACLFQRDCNPAERVSEAVGLADSGEIDLSGLVGAWIGKDVVAAGLFYVALDGSALVWPPEVRPDISPSEPAAVAVLKDTAIRADRLGCPFSQTIVAPDRIDQRHALEAAGFSHLAELDYLQRPLDRELPAGPAGLSDRIICFTEFDESRFVAVVERTYLGSHDCPAFSGYRSAAEALQSYRVTGVFTPQRWRLIEHAGRDVAVILVNDRPEERAHEIVYFGVVPEARGRRLGSDLISSALHAAAGDKCETVLAAVDAENQPAIQIYARLGFFSCGRHAVYLRRRVT